MEIVIADKSHSFYADIICNTIADAAQVLKGKGGNTGDCKTQA